MAQKGIHKDLILSTAIQLIEERGSPDLSMGELAAALGIRTPSLYNHIKNMDALYLDVIRRAADALSRVQLEAIAGRRGDEALTALADAYRRFAKEHTGLYRAVMTSPSRREAAAQNVAAAAAEPILTVLAQYGLTGEDAIHWQRILRSIIHGFLTQEEAGFFRHSPVDIRDSYRLAIQCFLTGLHNSLDPHSPERSLPHEAE